MGCADRRGSASGCCRTSLIQAVVGFSLLEVVNYMEHYGMLRQKVGVGDRQRYERVDPSHSWNSNNIATNVLLYHLQRHSDHHANPTRRYQALRDYQESPVLPTGYAGMIVLALVPAGLAAGHGPAGAGPLRRRRHPGQHQPAQAGPDPGAARRRGSRRRLERTDGQARRDTRSQAEVLAARCPGCSYLYEVEAGDEHEGFAAGTAWSDIPDDWCCPDCGVREKVDFVPVDKMVTGRA